MIKTVKDLKKQLEKCNDDDTILLHEQGNVYDLRICGYNKNKKRKEITFTLR